MTKRVLVAGIWHETNTFSSAATDLNAFRRYRYAAGSDILDVSTDTNTEIGGFIDEASQLDLELKPTLFAAAVPAGMVTDNALDHFVDKVCRRARQLGPLDGALIALHGAMVSESRPEAEAHFLQKLRVELGSRCPVVATFDYHANLSASLVDACDVLVGYETFPHVDMAERGREAARILGRLIETGERPRKAFRKLPLLLPPLLQITSSSPMSEVMAIVKALKTTHGIVSASVAAGFPWTDVEHLGAAALVYGDDGDVVANAADSLAGATWSRRHVAPPDLVPVEKAIAMAEGFEDGPVILVDAADNVGGGAPGDGTAILTALLASGLHSAVVVLYDPEAVATAGRSGDGQFDAMVGGNTDDQHGPPVRLRGEVEFCGDVEYFRDGTYMTGQRVRMGRVAVVNSRDIRVVLTGKRVMPFDKTHLRVVGIELEKQDIIVVKSMIAWQAAFGSIASAHFVVDTPGICALDLSKIKYVHKKTRLFPFDADAAWPKLTRGTRRSA